MVAADARARPAPPAPPPVAAARGAAFVGPGSRVFAGGVEDLGSTKLALPGEADDDREFDVVFQAGPLGMRLEERGGLVPLTMVTSVAVDGQAAAAGISPGCVVLGVNGEQYLSHAHTTATLIHGRRPVELRLRHAD